MKMIIESKSFLIDEINKPQIQLWFQDLYV